MTNPTETKPKRRLTTPEETRAVYERIVAEGIKPHAETIARAHDNGEVAVVFFNISDEHSHAMASADVRGYRDAVKSMGWRGGRSECVAWNRTRAEKFADALARTSPADPCAQWLRGRRPGRIFVWSGLGSLCINFDPKSGYSSAPGTGDHEWMA